MISLRRLARPSSMPVRSVRPAALDTTTAFREYFSDSPSMNASVASTTRIAASRSVGSRSNVVPVSSNSRGAAALKRLTPSTRRFSSCAESVTRLPVAMLKLPARSSRSATEGLPQGVGDRPEREALERRRVLLLRARRGPAHLLPRLDDVRVRPKLVTAEVRVLLGHRDQPGRHGPPPRGVAQEVHLPAPVRRDHPVADRRRVQQG